MRGHSPAGPTEDRLELRNGCAVVCCPSCRDLANAVGRARHLCCATSGAEQIAKRFFGERLTCRKPCVPSAGFQVLTEQMKQIAFVRPELLNGASHIPIVRAALREVLLEGLEEAVNFGKEFVRYERTPNGKVTAFFEDGTTAVGDVLVGADGTGSNVRQQYLPYGRIADTGIVGAACRLPITPDSRRRLPEHLLTRLTSVVPPKGTYMIVTQSIYRLGAKYIDAVGDHLIWVLISSRAAYGDANPKMMDGQSVRGLAVRMTDSWHPVFRELIADSVPNQVTAVPVLTSIPVDPWESTNITLLGDAIHNDPASGSGWKQRSTGCGPALSSVD